MIGCLMLESNSKALNIYLNIKLTTHNLFCNDSTYNLHFVHVVCNDNTLELTLHRNPLNIYSAHFVL
jgi:hypothetical protein